jgi:hypothetical protein
LQVLRAGRCLERVCLESNNTFSIRYLHPSDSGQYTCVAKSKFGQDQRQILLSVKVILVRFFYFNFVEGSSTTECTH